MDAPRWYDPRLLRTRALDTPMPPPQARDLAAWEARARLLRLQVLAAAGLWSDPGQETRQSPAAEVFERLEHPELGYSVEKVFFETLPGYYLTGNLYRPWPGGGRRPAILSTHGHGPAGRLSQGDAFGATSRAITFARMGYVVFSYDMAGYGDNLRIPHRWSDPAATLWGANPLGLQLWNSIRAVDFVSALPDVDPQRIGCTGESGGATQTFLLAAMDRRVAAAAPVCMISLHYQGGCVCENAPGLRLDSSNVEITALIAPRPMIIVSATGDWTVNTPRLEYPAIADIYGLYGEEARQLVESVQFEAPHNYNRQSREAVYDFFRRRLPVDPAHTAPTVPSEDDLRAPDAEEDLRVFARRPWPACPEGDAAVQNVIRYFRLRGEVALEAAAPAALTGVTALADSFLPYLLAVTGVQAVRPESVEARTEGDLVWLGRRGQGERFAARRLEGEATDAPAVLLASDGQAWAIYPFGTGAQDEPWAHSGRAAEVPNFLCYNRSDAALRAQDLLTALAWLRGGATLLRARRDCAVPALLARAVASTAVQALDVELGPEWGAETQEGEGRAEEPWLVGGNYLPGVLRSGGLAGLLALGAPGRVRVRTDGVLGHGALPGVRALYGALGAPEAFVLE